MSRRRASGGTPVLGAGYHKLLREGNPTDAIGRAKRPNLLSSIPTDVVSEVGKCLSVVDALRLATLSKQHSPLTIVPTDDGIKIYAPNEIVICTEARVATLSTLLARTASPTRLALVGGYWTPEYGEVVSKSWGATLKSIDVRDCDTLSDVSLEAITERCTHLECLNVSGCTELTSASIGFVLINCNRLTTLNVSGCSNLGEFKEIKMVKPLKLMSLNVEKCHSFTDDSLVWFAKHCPDLTSLNTTLCWALTDTSITAIVRDCSNLTALNVSKCYLLTDRSLIEMASSNIVLKTLNVGGCRELNGGGIEAIVVKNQSTLMALNVAGCTLSERAIAAIRNCSELTDESLVVAERGCWLTDREIEDLLV